MGQFCQVNTEILPFVLKIRFGALSFPFFSSIFKFSVDIRINLTKLNDLQSHNTPANRLILSKKNTEVRPLI